MEIIEFTKEEEILANYDILRLLYSADKYPHMSREFYSEMIPELMKNGYRQVAVLIDEKIVGVSSFEVITRLYMGRIMRVNDLVILEDYRGRGIGRKLIEYIKEQSIADNCNAMVLDTGIERKDAHKFYEKLGFKIHAHHYIKRV